MNLAELTQEKERKAVGALMLRQEEEEQCWSKKQAVHGADVCGPLILNLLRPRFFCARRLGLGGKFTAWW